MTGKKIKRLKNLSKQGCLWLLLCLMSILLGCSSVTVRPYGGEKDTSPPDYQDSKSFYVLAIFGDHTVNTSEVCGQQRVMQMQAVTTLSDWVQSLFTLFIYTPRTAKVWCEKVPQPVQDKAEVSHEI